MATKRRKKTKAKAPKPAAPATKPKQTGRPSGFNLTIVARICSQIANGASLRKVCEAEDMPARQTVFNWLAEHKVFVDQYTRACEERGHYLVEDALDICDEEVPDVQTEHGSHKDAAAVNAMRLRVDTRKWFASKLHPRVYGDKVSQEITGPDGGPIPLTATLVPIDYDAVIAKLQADYGPKSAGPGG